MDITNIQNKICHVCGKNRPTTREHVPPQSIGNKGKIKISYIDINGKELQQKDMYLKDGFWIPNLCKECNNKIGGKCGEAYKDFVRKISNSHSIEDSKGCKYIFLKNIYPLRILKQMLSMFLCAVTFPPEPVWARIQTFVRRRDALLPPDAPKIYLYMNISCTGRIVPMAGATINLFEQKEENQICMCSEISWPPLGIVFSYIYNNKLKDMEEITHWGRKYKFGDKINTSIRLPQRIVNTHYPLIFGNENDAAEEGSKLCWIIHIPEGSNSPNNVGVLLKTQDKYSDLKKIIN